MDIDAEWLCTTALFEGMEPSEAVALLPCLGARVRDFRRGETVLRMGETTADLGLVVQGSVNAEAAHYWGGSSLLGHMTSGQTFAESFAALPDQPLGVSVVAAEDSRVMLLNMQRLLTTCASGCNRHQQVIRNLVRISSQKNLTLTSRMAHTAAKTIRERLDSYLSEQARLAGSSHFTIPFDRQQLADYLEVDRSALSAELGRMQREGLLTTRRSEFTLHRQPRPDRTSRP